MAQTRGAAARKARCTPAGKGLRSCRPKGTRTRGKQSQCTSSGRRLRACHKSRPKKRKHK